MSACSLEEGLLPLLLLTRLGSYYTLLYLPDPQLQHHWLGVLFPSPPLLLSARYTTTSDSPKLVVTKLGAVA